MYCMIEHMITSIGFKTIKIFPRVIVVNLTLIRLKTLLRLVNYNRLKIASISAIVTFSFQSYPTA